LSRGTRGSTDSRRTFARAIRSCSRSTEPLWILATRRLVPRAAGGTYSRGSATARVQEMSEHLPTALGVLDLGMELHAPDRERRVRHRLHRARRRVGEDAPARRGDRDLVVVARPDPKLGRQSREDRMVAAVDGEL